MKDNENVDFQNVIWTHLASGDRYQIMNFGLREHDLEPVVIYAREGFGGPVWVRTCMEFFSGRFANLPEPEEMPMTTTVNIVVNDQASPKLKEFMAQIREKGLDPATVSAIIQKEGGQKLSGYNASDEIMTLEAFAETANKFLTEFRSTDGPEYERRKSVIRAICATFEVDKWTEIPALGRDDAVMALNAYKQDMARKADLESRKSQGIIHNSPVAPAPVQGVTDMKGMPINVGEYVELGSLLSGDRRDWGTEHYRKVESIYEGTVRLEGEGHNIWQPDQLICKIALDI